LDLFRKSGEEEYWVTSILEQPRAQIIIYEAGVLVIDEHLKVLTHKEKLLKDFFVAVEDGALRFVGVLQTAVQSDLTTGNYKQKKVSRKAFLRARRALWHFHFIYRGNKPFDPRNATVAENTSLPN
jgi:hypothetical protein